MLRHLQGKEAAVTSVADEYLRKGREMISRLRMVQRGELNKFLGQIARDLGKRDQAWHDALREIQGMELPPSPDYTKDIEQLRRNGGETNRMLLDVMGQLDA